MRAFIFGMVHRAVSCRVQAELTKNLAGSSVNRLSAMISEFFKKFMRLANPAFYAEHCRFHELARQAQ